MIRVKQIFDWIRTCAAGEVHASSRRLRPAQNPAKVGIILVVGEFSCPLPVRCPPAGFSIHMRKREFVEDIHVSMLEASQYSWKTTELPVNEIIFATGYTSMLETTQKILSADFAD